MVAVAWASSCSLDLMPSLATSICCRADPKKKKKKRKRIKKKRMAEGRSRHVALCPVLPHYTLGLALADGFMGPSSHRKMESSDFSSCRGSEEPPGRMRGGEPGGPCRPQALLQGSECPPLLPRSLRPRSRPPRPAHQKHNDLNHWGQQNWARKTNSLMWASDAWPYRS